VTPAPDTPAEVRAHPTRTLFVLALGALAYTLAQTMVVPALPEIQRHYGVDASDSTWVFTVFLVTSCVCTPILGRLGDMYGKERLLLISLGVFAAGNLVSGTAQSLEVLILGRAIQGAGGAVFPLAIGIIRDEFPRERVASGIGSISAMFGIGGGVGLVVSGLLIEWLGVDSIFWLSLVVSAAAAWATWRFVPESPVRVQARVDFGGAALLGLALLSLLLAVSEGTAWGWSSARILGLFAGAVVVGALWVAWERRVEDPMVDLALMARRPVWTANLAAMAVGLSMFASFILIPQFVQADPAKTGYGFGASITLSGIYLLPSALVMLGAGPLSGRLSTLRGSRLPLALGTVISSAAYFSLAGLHDRGWEIFVGSALLGLGIGLAFAAMANLIVEAVPQESTGVASGINTIARSIGAAVGAQVAAAILTASASGGGPPAESGFVDAFLFSAVGALFALGATMLVPRPSRSTAPVGVRGEPVPGASP
jgi:EmrB/QacA subfamily drug resistance transporter